MTKKHIHRLSRDASIARLKKQIQTVTSIKRKQLIVVFLLISFLFYSFISTLPTTHSQSSTPHSSDILYGGYTSQLDLVQKVSPSHATTSSIMELFGIDETTLRDSPRMSFSSLSNKSTNPLIIWSKSANYQFSLANSTQMKPVFVAKTKKTNTIIYGSVVPKQLYDELQQKVTYIGTSSKNVPFGIIKESGNLVTTWEASQVITECYQAPNSTLSYTHCPNSEQVLTSIKAENTTFKTDAHLLRTRPNDTIRYTLEIKNQSNTPIPVTAEVILDDILEYSKLDDSSGTFHSSTQSLKWPTTSLQPNQKNSYSFSVTLLDKVPLTKRNTHNSRSHDCAMSVYFGKLDTIYVQCPAQKVIERAGHTHLSPGILWFAWILLFIQCILLMRNSILLKDLLNQQHRERERMVP